MRPAYRFALASAVGVAALGVAWWWATTPGATTDSSPVIAPVAGPRADEAGVPPAPPTPGAPARPPTREEVLEDLQRSEEASLGAAEAARRRQVREQMLDARAKHQH